MRIWLRVFFLIGIAATLAVAHAGAQDASPVPAAAPTPLLTPGSYPDIDALREPGSTAKLFPQQPADAPPRRRGAGSRSGERPPRRRESPAAPRTAGSAPTMLSSRRPMPIRWKLRVAYRRDNTAAMVRDPRPGGVAPGSRCRKNRRAEARRAQGLLHPALRWGTEGGPVAGDEENTSSCSRRSPNSATIPSAARSAGRKASSWAAVAGAEGVDGEEVACRAVRSAAWSGVNWRYRLVVRSRPSQGWSTGSNPVSATAPVGLFVPPCIRLTPGITRGIGSSAAPPWQPPSNLFFLRHVADRRFSSP